AKGGGKFPPPSGANGKTRDKVAEAVGMSGRTYEKAKQVVEAAKAEPEKFGDLPEAMDKDGSVHKVHVEMKQRQGRNKQPNCRTTTFSREEMIGDPAAPAGSRHWAIFVRDSMRRYVEEIRDAVKSLRDFQRVCREHNGHAALEDAQGKPFNCFEQFCEEK